MMRYLSKVKGIPLAGTTKGTPSVFPSEGGVALDPITCKSMGIRWWTYNEREFE